VSSYKGEVDLKQLKSGDRRILAKAITLVESKFENHREQADSLLESILPDTGKSIRIGISGSPGVGKSTFIEAFGLHLIEQGRKVAVLAVDPSSPIAGGSILGDKTRMEELSRKNEAFIRPSPSAGLLGGVAHKTRETMLLCEAAGYDVILVETVGVGQSEFEVAAMVDFFLVLMLPNAGDELQGIKRGILELANALIVNKCDGENVRQAERTRQHYQNAFQLFHASDFWKPQVLTCSSLEKRNMDTIWQMIVSYEKEAIQKQVFYSKRAEQNSEWMQKLLHEMLRLQLTQNPLIKEKLPLLQTEVLNGRITPFKAAKQIIEML
jgi:LAO/AO transport system kinase